VAAYVVDSLPNMAMTPGLVEERAPAFLSTLATAHPSVPILVVGATTRVLHPAMAELFEQADGALRAIVAALQDASTGVVRFVDGADLLGDDEDGTVDTVHPNDLGFARMAMHLEPLIADALAGNDG
jgi:lysophospholipase L1-like esterase